MPCDHCAMRKNKAKPNQLSDQDPVWIELTKKRAAVWLILFCVVSAWIFLLGILVGRGTAPVQFDINALQKELSELRLAIIEKEQKLIKTDTDYLSWKTDFDFHEALKKLNPDTNLKVEKETSGEGPEKSAPSETIPSPPATKQPAQIETKPDSNKNQPAEAQEADDKTLTIQIASLRDSKIADQLVGSLKKKGYPAYKTVGMISEDDIWYRVRVGFYKTRVDSLPVLSELKKEYKGAILVNR